MWKYPSLRYHLICCSGKNRVSKKEKNSEVNKEGIWNQNNTHYKQINKVMCWVKKCHKIRLLGILALLCMAYMLGVSLGRESRQVLPAISNASKLKSDETKNWGLGFGAEGSKPTGTATIDEMKKYNAYYLAESDDMKLYLTFDCGFENGNTEKILDALKKHEVKATFFVVGHFLETAPELVKRMVEEGHTVGNHTYHHPDMSKMSGRNDFKKEMDSVKDKYREITGQEMPMYYRPPQGKYSVENLKLAQAEGYKTFFWSLAYVDWITEKQPSHEEAFSKLTKRVHPGAIVLLHNTSKTNGEIMDELLGKWEEMGYSFGTLEEFE